MLVFMANIRPLDCLRAATFFSWRKSDDTKTRARNIPAIHACDLGDSSPRVGATHYRTDFPADDGDALSDVDWDDSYIGANGNTAGVAANDAGVTYLWWYNATGLGETQTAAVTTKNFAATTTKNPNLVINWEQRLENQQDGSETDVTGTPVDIRLAVEVGGKWYASRFVYATTPAGVGNSGPWDVRSATFNPAADNWLELKLGDSGAELGAAPSSDLSGDVTGIGFVATFSQRQTVNFNFLEVAGVPEPTAPTKKAE